MGGYDLTDGMGWQNFSSKGVFMPSQPAGAGCAGIICYIIVFHFVKIIFAGN